MVLACWSVIRGYWVRDVKDTLCGDGDSCGISSRPSRLNFETVSLQSPRHCCIQKIYITIRRTIWGNKFKRKLCPRILQFSGTTSVSCEKRKIGMLILFQLLFPDIATKFYQLSTTGWKEN